MLGGGFDIAGTPGNDTLTGTNTSDRLSGLGGEDILAGGQGDDRLDGGAGADAMSGGSGDDTYFVDNSGDVVLENANEGTDTVRRAITYALPAGVENLTLTGTAAINAFGNALNNALIGNAADNVLMGGEGDDTLDGGGGSDTADYSSSAAGVSVDLNDPGPQDTGQGLDTLVNIENLTGSDYDDVLTGDFFRNVLAGGDGNDTLLGGFGSDLLRGGRGNDILDGGAGLGDTAAYDDSPAAVAVDLNITTAQNTLGAGTDTLSGIEHLTGSSYNDTLKGNSAGNLLIGGGNDALYGNAGNDTLAGGAGDDYLDGGAGNDTADYSGASGGVTVDLQTSAAQPTGDGIDTLAGIENLTGSNFNDTLTGNSSNNVLAGNAGNDTLLGNAGNDNLYGGAGDDYLDGGAGTDTAWYSTAAGPVGIDLGVITAQNTGEGPDTLLNIENLHGSYYGDTLVGNGAANSLYGDSGDDTLQGLAGNDALYGDGGNDSLNGDLGDDTLDGGGGEDTLSGGDGNDTLVGGQGTNVLNGGPGTDTASYANSKWGVTVDLNLWFWRRNLDLRVGIRGTNDWVTIEGWYGGSTTAPPSPIERLDASDGAYYLLANQIQQLVNAMAVFDPETQGNLNVPQNPVDEAMPVIAAAWQQA